LKQLSSYSDHGSIGNENEASEKGHDNVADGMSFAGTPVDRSCTTSSNGAGVFVNHRVLNGTLSPTGKLP
jgi:hypothetical protein